MMRKRKFIASLMSLLMLISLFIPQQSAFAAESGIEVQFNNGNTGTNSNTINAKFKVVNTGGSSVSLSQLKLRYYYTKDADKSQNFFCDYSGMMSGGAHTNMTNKITGTIVNMSSSVATADTYLEVGFTSDAGSLAAGGSIEIQTRVARSDWSNYNQANDFSYKSAGSYEVWDQVAAYLSGSLVFGKSPTEGHQTKDPEISPKSATFNKSVPKNITVALTLNGNTFKGITGLTRNTHYTVSGNTVTLLSSYLTTLALGQKRLTFDFGVVNNPIIDLTITEDIVVDKLEVKIGRVTGNTGDTVTVPVNFANVAKAGNVGTCNFYIDYDTNLLEAVSVSAGNIITNSNINFSSRINDGSISFLFLDETIGDELIKKDGVFANITFKIKGSAGKTASLSFQNSGAFGDANMKRITGVNYINGSVTIKEGIPAEELSVKIGTVKGNTGDTVTVPVNFTNVAKAGNVGTCNFYIDYDTNLLEAVSVSAGNIITNSNINFSSRINDGSISFLFLDETIGDELIKKDGVFANITFKIKGSAGKTASLSFQDSGAFGNAKMERIAGVKYINGSVIIEEGIPTGELFVAMGSKKANKGDTVVIPVTLEDVAEVGNIGASNMYINYDASVLEAVSVEAGNIIVNKNNLQSSIEPGSIGIGFIDSTLGEELITSDGVFANITFKLIGEPGKTSDIKFTSETAFGNYRYNEISNVSFTNGSITINKNVEIGFSVIVGTKDAEKGKEVTVPINFIDVAKAGNVGTCNFYLSYDSALLEAVSVKAGGIITNPNINFSSRINTESDSISFLYLDNTIGDELITEDGIFATITFKVLGAVGKTASVKFEEGGAFGDADMSRINDVIKVDGGVVITATENPTISAETEVFDKYSPDNIMVTLTPNGNTFIGITGLRKGTDYTVSDNTVIIRHTYLSTLDLGPAILEFDFGVPSNPLLSLIIKDSTPATEDDLAISVGTVSGYTGDTVLVPITAEDVKNAGSIGAYSIVVRYDSTLLNPVAITDGDILADKGIAEAVAVSGSAITLAEEDSMNYMSSIAYPMVVAPEYERAIYLSFNAFESQEITEDGVLVYIEFEILGEAGEIAAVSIDRSGVFENGDKEVFTNISYTDGAVIIIGEGPLNPSITPISASFDKYTPSDITVFLTPNGNTFYGVSGLVEGKDYSVSANTVKIFGSYLSTLELGSASLIFDFGEADNPSIEIEVKDTKPVETNFNISIGQVSGKKGDTITVPVTIGNISKVGSIGTCNFYISFDDTLLEAVSVSAGNIIINPGINFSSRIREGSISCLYLDNTIGDELITEDGVMLTITFKILGSKSYVTPLAFEEGGAFGNGNMERIEIKKIDGNVQIN